MRRTERTLAAAQASLQAGAFGKADDLIALAEAEPLDSSAARHGLAGGRITFASGLGSDAPPLLLKAARAPPTARPRPGPRDARQHVAAASSPDFAGAGDLLEVSRAARASPPPAHPPRLVDLVLDSFALLGTNGPTAAAPLLRRATSAFASPGIPEERSRWGLWPRWRRSSWDDAGWRLTVRQVQLARDVGALDQPRPSEPYGYRDRMEW